MPIKRERVPWLGDERLGISKPARYWIVPALVFVAGECLAIPPGSVVEQPNVLSQRVAGLPPLRYGMTRGRFETGGAQ